MTGQQIRDIIALCGLTGETANTIQAAIAFALGIDVPIGSVRRALSRARGTWKARGNVIKVYDDVYELGVAVYLRTTPIDSQGVYLFNGNVVGGGDIIAESEHAAGTLPYAYHLGGILFNTAKGKGRSISQTLRDTYESALDWVYFTIGLSGGDAHVWLDSALDGVEQWLHHNPSAIPLTPLYTNGAGVLTIAEAWELVR